MKKQNVKTLAAVALVVGFATTLGGQRAPVRNASLPDFDIRSLRPQGSAAVEQTLATATVERRIAALMSLQAAPDQMQLGTRIIPNQYGLPKVYRREGRSLSGRSTLKREEIARGFLQSQSAVFSLSSADM